LLLQEQLPELKPPQGPAKMKLRIAHLYPGLLNIYGDRGNILSILKRCSWRNIEADVTEINQGDAINPDLYDFYFMGGGQDKQQIAVSKELLKHKSALTDARDNGAVFLAICGGYQLLGNYYKPHQGEELPGISLLDVITVAGNKRFIGNVTVNLNIEDINPVSLTGFENHSGLTYLQGDTKPLGFVTTGNGNNGRDKTEGAVYKKVFGTYLHGSLLPKNPHFADYLIKLALERKYGEIKLNEINDETEFLAHKKALNRKY